MDLISVRMPAEYVDALDELSMRGKYAGRSEAIRVAIRDFIRELRSTHGCAYVPRSNTNARRTIA